MVISFAPVAPSGCPKAIAPPFTFNFVLSALRSAAQANGTGANASFTSYKSISSIDKFAVSRALNDAGIGPVSMKTGSSPTTEIDTISALGFF